MPDPTLAALIHRILEGDETASSHLVERLGPFVYRRLAPYIRDPEDRKDLVQEVFITALTRLHQVKHPERLKYWLLTITDNRLRMWQRRRLTQTRMDARWEADYVDLAVNQEDSPDIYRLLREAVNRLSESYRQVVIHHYFNGYSYRDTAVLLGLKVDTVRSRLQKARQKIKQEMQPMATQTPLQTIKLTSADLDILRTATVFSNRDPDRSILGGVYIDTGGRVVATDGHRLFLQSSVRLAQLPAPMLLGAWYDIKIPNKAKGTLTIFDENASLKITGQPDQTPFIMNEKYPEYERVIPTDWSLKGHVSTTDFMAIIDSITDYLSPQHPVNEDDEWEYKPAVELRFSTVENTLSLITTRDMGYSKRDSDKSIFRPYDPVGDWSFSTSIPMEQMHNTDDKPARTWMDYQYLKQGVQAFLDADISTIQIKYIKQSAIYEFARIVFVPVDRDDPLVLQMPLRMDTPERAEG